MKNAMVLHKHGAADVISQKNLTTKFLEDYLFNIISNPQNINNKAVNAKKLYPRVVKGGSFMNPDYRVRSATRFSSNKQWKKQDPQIPRSRWWHTDAQFLGFRIVRPLETPNEEDKKKYWIN